MGQDSLERFKPETVQARVAWADRIIGGLTSTINSLRAKENTQ